MTKHRLRATALRLSGSATALTAALGVFCVRNAGLAHEWRICSFPFGCIYNGGPVSPLPTTGVILPNGAVLGIGLYAGLVIASGLVVGLAAWACAQRPRRAWRLVLSGAEALLLLCLVCFQLPPPARLSSIVGPCSATNSCPTTVSRYPAAIPSVWYLAPCAALGLLAVGLGLSPARPRRTGDLPEWSTDRR